MKNISNKISTAIGMAAFLAVTATSYASPINFASQTVTFEVTPISAIAVSGDPSPLVISSTTAGSTVGLATDSSTTYSITSNESNKKIVASLDENMPGATSLSVALQAPEGASSTGMVPLSVEPVEAVTGISQVSATDLGISYGFQANTAAGPVSGSRIVTLTVTD